MEELGKVYQKAGKCQLPTEIKEALKYHPPQDVSRFE